MTFTHKMAFILAMAALPLSVQAQDQAAPAAGRGGRGGPPITVWAPKPVLAPYVAPNRPHVKVADLIKQHAREKSWSQTVVRDATDRPPLSGPF